MPALAGHHVEKEMRDRDDFDHYPTPEPLVRAALTSRILPIMPAPRTILDPGAGQGVWGRVARSIWPNAFIVGTEIRNLPKPPEYDRWISGRGHIGIDLPGILNIGDTFEPSEAPSEWPPFLHFESGRPVVRFDLVIGNPPYGDLWDLQQRALAREAKKAGQEFKRPARPESAGPVSDAEAFVRQSLIQVVRGGLVFFLLRSAFLESQKRAAELWKTYCPERVSALAKRPSFTGDGKTDATAYAMFLWRRGDHRDYYMGDWLEWEDSQHKRRGPGKAAKAPEPEPKAAPVTISEPKAGRGKAKRKAKYIKAEPQQLL